MWPFNRNKEILDRLENIEHDLHEIRANIMIIKKNLDYDILATVKMRKELKESLALLGSLKNNEHSK